MKAIDKYNNFKLILEERKNNLENYFNSFFDYLPEKLSYSKEYDNLTGDDILYKNTLYDIYKLEKLITKTFNEDVKILLDSFVESVNKKSQYCLNLKYYLNRNENKYTLRFSYNSTIYIILSHFCNTNDYRDNYNDKYIEYIQEDFSKLVCENVNILEYKKSIDKLTRFLEVYKNII